MIFMTAISIWYLPMSDSQRITLHALAYEAARVSGEAPVAELRRIAGRFDRRSYADLTRGEYAAATDDLINRIADKDH